MGEELFHLALMNLMRARARLAMTSGGVLVGTAAVILLIALTIGLQQAAEAGVGSSGTLTEVPVYNYGPPDINRPLMNNDVVRAFYKIEGVAAVIPTMSLQGGMLIAGKYNGYSSIQGIEPALLPYMQLPFQDGVLEVANNQMVCGAGVQENFYDPKAKPEEYQPITVDLLKQSLKLELSTAEGISRLQMTVKGVFAIGGGNFDWACFLPMAQVIALNEQITGQPTDWEVFQYEQIIIRTTGREATDHVVSEVRKMGYMPGGIGDFLNQINNLFSTMRLMLGGMGGVALLVAAFGVANTMTMAILERTREIGLMKAIGASDNHILTIFLMEAAMVGFCGGLAGVSVSLLIQQAVNQAVANMPVSQDGGGMTFLPVDPAMLKNGLIVIPPELILFAMCLAVGIALLAGLYPALRAARLQPVIALKTE
jgi:putative ABC transport system permease protein